MKRGCVVCVSYVHCARNDTVFPCSEWKLAQNDFDKERYADLLDEIERLEYKISDLESQYNANSRYLNNGDEIDLEFYTAICEDIEWEIENLEDNIDSIELEIKRMTSYVDNSILS